MPVLSGKAPLVITPGDPAGIGTELVVKAWQQGCHGFIFMENQSRIEKTAAELGISAVVHRLTEPAEFDMNSPVLQIINIDWASPPVPGCPDEANAPQIIAAIEQAVTWTRAGTCAAVVTNPIAKAPLLQSGFAHPGHTEFLGTFGNTRPGGPMMMLACNGLRVVPVSVHIPLADVAGHLSTDLIIDAARLLAEDLRRFFDVEDARIAICGLNPHAGEQGKIGNEEIEIIAPAISALQRDGINVSGPHSADSLFHPAARESYDAVIGMYHDQVLIPLKTIDFYGGVNVTLGLDFIRTSPDHGTGFDIAGKGMARADSLVAAIKMAGDMARRV